MSDRRWSTTARLDLDGTTQAVITPTVEFEKKRLWKILKNLILNNLILKILILILSLSLVGIDPTRTTGSTYATLVTNRRTRGNMCVIRQEIKKKKIIDVTSGATASSWTRTTIVGSTRAGRRSRGASRSTFESRCVGRIRILDTPGDKFWYD